MHSQQLVKLLVACMTAGSLILAGCNLQRQFDPQVSEGEKATQPATNAGQTPTLSPTSEPQAQKPKADVPFVPTPQNVVDEMLRMARVGENDVLYDLGSGDGRIVITAAQKFGTRGTGIEIEPELIAQSLDSAKKAGVEERVKFLQQDLFETDLGDATVVTLYLLPEVNLKLRPKLLSQLKPGTRVVSHNYDMGEWEPERVEQVKSQTGEHVLYYWVVPETVPENLRRSQ